MSLSEHEKSWPWLKRLIPCWSKRCIVRIVIGKEPDQIRAEIESYCESFGAASKLGRPFRYVQPINEASWSYPCWRANRMCQEGNLDLLTASTENQEAEQTSTTTNRVFIVDCFSCYFRSKLQLDLRLISIFTSRRVVSCRLEINKRENVTKSRAEQFRQERAFHNASGRHNLDWRGDRLLVPRLGLSCTRLDVGGRACFGCVSVSGPPTLVPPCLRVRFFTLRPLCTMPISIYKNKFEIKRASSSALHLTPLRSICIFLLVCLASALPSRRLRLQTVAWAFA